MLSWNHFWLAQIFLFLFCMYFFKIVTSRIDFISNFHIQTISVSNFLWQNFLKKFKCPRFTCIFLFLSAKLHFWKIDREWVMLSWKCTKWLYCTKSMEKYLKFKMVVTLKTQDCQFARMVGRESCSAPKARDKNFEQYNLKLFKNRHHSFFLFL